MAHTQVTFTTLLPDEITDLISKQCFLHEADTQESTVINTITQDTTEAKVSRKLQEIVLMLGFPLMNGLLRLFGIIFRGQTVKISSMT